MQKNLKLHPSKLIAFALVGLSTAAGFAPQAFARPGKDGAQTEGRRQNRGKRAGLKAMEQLNLSDAQKAQIKPIMQKAMADTRAVRQDTTLAPDARRARTKAIREASQAEIQAVLTPAQRAQMKQMAGNRGLDKMATELNLTPAQKTQLLPILSKSQEQRRAIQADADLSPAQKKAQLKALRETTQSQTDAILTPQQRQQMDDMKATKKQEKRDGKGKGRGKNRRNADNANTND